jgi:pimeloyl-ACP methyl ester carboxylesterase
LRNTNKNLRKVECTDLCAIIATFSHAMKRKRVSILFRLSTSPLTRLVDGQVPAEFPQTLPVLLMFGTKDPTCPSGYVERMPVLVKNLSIVALRDKGHWVLVEAKDEVTNEVLRWLGSSGKPKKAKL